MRHRRFHLPASTPTRGRLSARREALVHGVFALLWTSGIGWLVWHYGMRRGGEFGDLPDPLEAWWLRLHGAAGLFALWLLGLLWAIHLVPAWTARRRTSGIVLGVLALLLAVSGYLLYYVGDESARDLIAWTHWGIGALLPLAFLPHVLRGRTRRRGDSRHERGGSPP